MLSTFNQGMVHIGITTALLFIYCMQVCCLLSVSISKHINLHGATGCSARFANLSLAITTLSYITFVQYKGGLYDYPAAPDWDHYVDQSQNPKVQEFKRHTEICCVIAIFFYP